MSVHGRIYFVDAAHLLHNAVPSHGWIKRNHRVELPTNSGRNRLNVLGAYSPDDHSLIAIEDTASCDAEMVCRLLHKLRAAHPEAPLLLVLDNVRYQRAKRVQALAEELQITLLFLPPYSPNLNLIEERPTDYTWRRRQPQHHPNLPSLPSFGGSDRRSGTALSPKGGSNLLGYLPA